MPASRRLGGAFGRAKRGLNRSCALSELVLWRQLGWNDVEFHGSAQIATPNLQKLAGDGVILDNFYVQPVCSPTRSSLLTGRHVIHSGIYDPDCDPGTTCAPPDIRLRAYLRSNQKIKRCALRNAALTR